MRLLPFSLCFAICWPEIFFFSDEISSEKKEIIREEEEDHQRRRRKSSEKKKISLSFMTFAPFMDFKKNFFLFCGFPSPREISFFSSSFGILHCFPIVSNRVQLRYWYVTPPSAEKRTLLVRYTFPRKPTSCDASPFLGLCLEPKRGSLWKFHG